MSEITLIGIDLAKSIFRIHAQDATGRCVFNKNVKRENLVTFLVQTPACTVVMEACGSSHYWARKIESLGHVVHLIHPKFVIPYRLGDKNDANDAAAICAAFLRPNMRFVKIRTREQSHEKIMRAKAILTCLIRCMKVSVVVPFGSVLRDKKVSFEQSNDTIDQYAKLRAIALVC